jgi:hypothetical protein
MYDEYVSVAIVTACGIEFHTLSIM